MLAHKTRVQAQLAGSWQEQLAGTPVKYYYCYCCYYCYCYYCYHYYGLPDESEEGLNVQAQQSHRACVCVCVMIL